MLNQGKQVLILSLDGATFDVLRPLAAQGYLPTLAGILEAGLCAELSSVIPPVTAPAWTSFMTGKNPDKHGIFDFTRFDHSDYRWKLNNSQRIRSKTIWQILSEHQRRVVVLNLPYIYPTYEVNGILVAGWDAPSAGSFTYPEELSREIYKIVPDYGSSLDLSLWNYLPTDSDAEFARFIGKLVRSFEQSATLASHFLKKENWDVFMVHFQQTDWIQHKLWGYVHRACQNANDKSNRVQQVRICYREFDRCVGQLLQEVQADRPIIIILSDHGFGGNFGTICPNYVLRKLGHYCLQDDADNPLKQSLRESRFAPIRNAYKGLRKVRHAARGRQALKTYKSWADMVNETVPSEKSRVDWSRTKAAYVVGSEVGFIYVNLKGRSPCGCVNPGIEYDHTLATLVEEFHRQKHPRTGENVISRVARGDEIYRPSLNGVRLPDLVLIPVEGYVVGAGLAQAFVPEDGERGDHRRCGVLLVHGPGLRNQVGEFRPNLIDLAPTILHALHLPVPRDMDGRVLEEIFEERRPVHFEDVDNSRKLIARDYAQAEAELIEQRLRGLGYVE